LGAAHLRARVVDSARAVRVEERAPPFIVRRARGEKLGMMLADLVGLDVEHRQVVDTARPAPFTALKPRLVQNMKPTRIALDVCVHARDRVVQRSSCVGWTVAHGRHGTLRARGYCHGVYPADRAYGALRDDVTEAPQCLACGACCFSRLETYVRVTGDDYSRLADRASELVFWEGNRAYMRMVDGHCSALRIAALDGHLVCGAYETRPDTCRDLTRGSGACLGEIDAKHERPLLMLGRHRTDGVHRH
jgi:hypothetical protein